MKIFIAVVVSLFLSGCHPVNRREGREPEALEGRVETAQGFTTEGQQEKEGQQQQKEGSFKSGKAP